MDNILGWISFVEPHSVKTEGRPCKVPKDTRAGALPGWKVGRSGGESGRGQPSPGARSGVGTAVRTERLPGLVLGAEESGLVVVGAAVVTPQ